MEATWGAMGDRDLPEEQGEDGWQKQRVWVAGTVLLEQSEQRRHRTLGRAGLCRG